MASYQDSMDRFLDCGDWAPGAITVLSGAGISAESGIPTFRGPEGYWTVGSNVYQPQEMATFQMFQRNPKAVWQWYLYRLSICQAARPNEGHMALVQLEQLIGERFTLITQNVDNLHLRAGQNPKHTYQIHGNIFFGRCAAACQPTVNLLPAGVSGKAKNDPISDSEWKLLHCQKCNSLLRPHVLWFDERYNEQHYRLDSSLDVAQRTRLLIVVGTSGGTNLPNQVVHTVYNNGGRIIDINMAPNPFGDLTKHYSNGLMLRGPSSTLLPLLFERIKTILAM